MEMMRYDEAHTLEQKEKYVELKWDLMHLNLESTIAEIGRPELLEVASPKVIDTEILNTIKSLDLDIVDDTSEVLHMIRYGEYRIEQRYGH